MTRRRRVRERVKRNKARRDLWSPVTYTYRAPGTTLMWAMTTVRYGKRRGRVAPTMTGGGRTWEGFATFGGGPRKRGGA